MPLLGQEENFGSGQKEDGGMWVVWGGEEEEERGKWAGG